MPKTPLILEARQRLRALGDQLQYMSFADRLVEKHLSEFVSAFSSSFTTEIFPDNPKARGIHVRLSALPDFRVQALMTGHGAVVTAGYEVCESYVEKLIEHINRFGLHSPSTPSKGTPEEQLQECLEQNGIKIDVERFETFKYLRLRRNQITHLRGEPTSELARLIRTRGTHLMRYWQYDGGLDFSKPSTSYVSEHEAIGMLRFMRIVLDEFDIEAANLVVVDKIVPDLESALLESQPHLQGPNGRVRRARKIAALLYLLHGMDVDDADVEAIISE